MIRNVSWKTIWQRPQAFTLALFATLILPAPAHTKALSASACLEAWNTLDANRKNGGHDLLTKHLGESGAPSVSADEKQRAKLYLEQLETIRFRCRAFVPPPPGLDP